MKRFHLVLAMYLLILLPTVACFSHAATVSEITQSTVNSAIDNNAILYVNTLYGFSFSLPESWMGYSVWENTWEGFSTDSLTGENVVETGPLISIRHPKWTSQNPRQDIPIMVFTLNQWNSLQQGKSHIGAAPIGPRELGRNSSCVFALPARYNYAFPEGYKEVETILNAKPLKPLPIIKE